jgi:fatty-acyl-CoA synthase
VQPGDRVATFAWNGYRHLELYYAVPCMGAVLHTLNIRLFEDQLEYIIGHAEDTLICVDADLLPLLEKLSGRMPSVRHFVVMSDVGPVSTDLAPAHDYETLLAAEDAGFEWPELEETAPMGLCYTSGTTGNPKGVMYTHRSNFLHTVVASLTDTNALSRVDTVLPVVPMFHANAWGMPYAACMLGAKLVFTGPMMDGASLCQLMADERVTFTAGVPTIWLGVMRELADNPGRYDLSALQRMVCGGSSPPRALIDWFETELGIEFIQAWGMTETNPLGSISRPKAKMRNWSREELLDRVKTKAGIISPGLEARVVDDEGKPVPHDGVAMGRLLVRGPWITGSYYKDPAEEKFPGGWLDTGDIATLDTEGYIAIADRAKDLIKSGGEWISSVDLENAIMAMPGVAAAAVIAIPHERWEERPLACVTCLEGATVTKDDVLAYLGPRFAKWWLPDDVVFVEVIPTTSVGKFDKKVLRTRFAGGHAAG